MNSLAAQLNPFIAELQRRWDVPGLAVAVVGRDGPVLVKAYGVRSVGTSVPADVDTSFAIGSCSKAFTTALAAALVDAAVIGWDDPIRKYLPSFELYDRWISDHVTLRDLLANRTGLSRASVGEYGSDLSRAELLHQARHIQPVAEFRDQFTYCNVGYAAAAGAIAAAAGLPFDETMVEYLLRPLGLDRSLESEASNVAAPHYRIDGKVQAVPPMQVDNLAGAIGRSLSARDAARWLAFHLAQGRPEDSRPFPVQHLRETHLLQVARRDRGANDGYGLGWHVRNRRIQHDGATRGFRANIWCDLEGGLAIFVAANLGSGLAPVAITNRVIQLMRGETLTDWITQFDEMEKTALQDRIARFNGERAADPVSASRWSLDDFVGTYRHQGFGLLHIEPKDDHLWFRIDGLSGFDGPLMRYSGLNFEYQGDRDAMAWPAIAVATTPTGERARIRFRDSADKITGLEWQDWFGAAEFVRTS